MKNIWELKLTAQWEKPEKRPKKNRDLYNLETEKKRGAK